MKCESILQKETGSTLGPATEKWLHQTISAECNLVAYLTKFQGGQ